MKPLTFGSLFAGIGGFDLGFERAGMVCKWQVEIDEHANKVLEKHWPKVQRWDDIKTWPPIGEWNHETYPMCAEVDCICGGFPRQDISNAGPRIGLGGARSILWKEYSRIIGILRPRYVVVENVAALLIRGMDGVLADLAALGYDAEWKVLSAYQFGLPQIRERVFIVAYPKQDGRRQGFQVFTGEPCQTILQRSHYQYRGGFGGRIRAFPQSEDVGVHHGFSDWFHRLGQCGNAVCPIVAEWVAKQIIAYEERLNHELQPCLSSRKLNKRS